MRDCPSTAGTNDHKQGGLKQQNRAVSWLWRPESAIEELQDHEVSA